MKHTPIQRLIQLKTEHVNQLRQDLQQLEQLVEDNDKLHQQALAAHVEYAEQIQVLEAGGGQLFGMEMIDRRRYLAQLHQESSRQAVALDNLRQQCEYAQQGLKQAYMEKKSLDLLLERKLIADTTQQNRKAYAQADDAHVTRNVQGADSEHY